MSVFQWEPHVDQQIKFQPIKTNPLILAVKSHRNRIQLEPELIPPLFNKMEQILKR